MGWLRRSRVFVGVAGSDWFLTPDDLHINFFVVKFDLSLCIDFDK